MRKFNNLLAANKHSSALSIVFGSVLYIF